MKRRVLLIVLASLPAVALLLLLNSRQGKLQPELRHEREKASTPAGVLPARIPEKPQIHLAKKSGNGPAALYVKVVDTSGRAAPHVTVSLMADGFENELDRHPSEISAVSSAKTGIDGNISFGAKKYGWYALKGVGSGLGASFVGPFELLKDYTSITLTMLPVWRIEGRAVLDSGVPYVGELRAWPLGLGPGASCRVCTDERGNFMFSAVTQGVWCVGRVPKGRAVCSFVSLEIPTVSYLLLRVPDQTEIAGTVMDGEGRLVGGAFVVLEIELCRYPASRRTVSVSTDESGRFHVKCPIDCRFRVKSIRGRGRGVWLPGRNGFRMRSPSGAVKLRLQLENGESVHGTVVNESTGDAVRDGRVYLFVDNADQAAVAVSRIGEDGSFVFPRVAIGDFVFFVRSKGLLCAGGPMSARDASGLFFSSFPGAWRVSVHKGSAPSSVVLRMEPAKMIRGTVVYADGSGAAGIVIEAKGQKGAEARCVSSVDGTFVLKDLADCGYRLEARIGESLEPLGTFQVGASRIIVVLKPTGGVAGRCVADKGRDMVGTWIVFMKETIAKKYGGGRELMVGRFPKVAVSDNGDYVMSKLPVGVWHVFAIPPGHAVVDGGVVDVLRGRIAQRNIVVGVGESISGFVENESEEAISGAMVYADPCDGGYGIQKGSGAKAVTGYDGRFRASGLDGTEFLVRVVATGYRDAVVRYVPGSGDLRIVLEGN